MAFTCCASVVHGAEADCSLCCHRPGSAAADPGGQSTIAPPSASPQVTAASGAIFEESTGWILLLSLCLSGASASLSLSWWNISLLLLTKASDVALGAVIVRTEAAHDVVYEDRGTGSPIGTHRAPL